MRIPANARYVRLKSQYSEKMINDPLTTLAVDKITRTKVGPCSPTQFPVVNTPFCIAILHFYTLLQLSILWHELAFAVINIQGL